MVNSVNPLGSNGGPASTTTQNTTPALWAISPGVEPTLIYPDGTTANISGSSSNISSLSQFALSNPTMNVNAASQALLKSGFSNTRTKKGQISGGRRLKAVLIGDSTTLSAGAFGYSNGATSFTNARNGSVQAYMAQYLDSLAIPAYGESQFGDGGTTGIVDYDSRVAFGGTWSYGGNSFGGQCFQATTSNNTYSFTPNKPCDTFDFYYLILSGGGTFTLSSTGSASVGPISSNAATSSLGKITYSGTLGNTPLVCTVNTPSTAGVYVLGVDAYNSTDIGVSVLAGGIQGSITHAWSLTTTGYSYLNALLTINPDIAFIQCGINDAHLGTTIGGIGQPNTFIGDLDTLVSALLTNSTDVMIDTHYPASVAATPRATQKTYHDALVAYCITKGLPYNDIFNKWGSYEAMSAMYSPDATTTLNSSPRAFYSGPSGAAVHGTANSYATRAQCLAAVLQYI